MTLKFGPGWIFIARPDSPPSRISETPVVAKIKRPEERLLSGFQTLAMWQLLKPYQWWQVASGVYKHPLAACQRWFYRDDNQKYLIIPGFLKSPALLLWVAFWLLFYPKCKHVPRFHGTSSPKSGFCWWPGNWFFPLVNITGSMPVQDRNSDSLALSGEVFNWSRARSGLSRRILHWPQMQRSGQQQGKSPRTISHWITGSLHFSQSWSTEKNTIV